MYKEKQWRSVVKTVTWRMTATFTTFLLAMLFFGELEKATALAILEMVLKTFLYYVHERIYNKMKFGKEEIAPFVLWFTGLPEAGKTTLAKAVHGKLIELDRKAEWVDGENVRELFPTLGYSKEERIRHVERVGHLSSILEKQNISVVASFVSPYEESRQFVRRLTRNFIEVFVNTPLELCEQRDSKGLYAKARKGEIKQFTGIDDPYEPPKEPEIEITPGKTLEESTQLVMKYLKMKMFI